MKTIAQIIASIKDSRNTIRKHRVAIRDYQNMSSDFSLPVRICQSTIDVCKINIKNDISWIRSIQGGF